MVDPAVRAGDCPRDCCSVASDTRAPLSYAWPVRSAGATTVSQSCPATATQNGIVPCMGICSTTSRVLASITATLLVPVTPA